MESISRAEFLQKLNPSIAPRETDQATIATTGLAPYTGPWGQAQIAHLIRRTLFGLKPSDLKYFSTLTLEQSLEVLLVQTPLPEPPVNVYNHEKFTDPDVPWGKTWVHASFGDPEGEQDGLRVQNLKAWWVGQMLHQDRSVTEKMTLFLSNFLAAQMFLMKDARLDYGYLATLRSYALGNYKELVRAITTNPGMLEYLNGNVNSAKAPNENYARELQELFTVGKGPDSHYTESDVKQAARVLTGWGTGDRPGKVTNLFKPDQHDTGDKTFSSFYNNTVIKGRKGQEGKAETDELIDMIFRQPETAKNICRNLYRWFVYYHIDDTIEETIITPLAQVFIKNNYEIKTVLHLLLGSEHFFDPLNMGCQIKNPIDLLVGTCRQFSLRNYTADLHHQYQTWSLISYHLNLLGMDPGDPPNVAGWPATYQYPLYGRLWINSTTLSLRNSITDSALSLGGTGGANATISLDIINFTQQLSKPENVNILIEESIRLLSTVPWPEHELTYLKTILLSGQTNDYYWAEAWKKFLSQPTDEIALNVIFSRLSAYYTYILQRSAYQLF